MNANELRIGNYVNLKDKDLYKIDRGYDLEKIEDWEGTDYCTPIPLTEEWLLKFGWGKDSDYINTYINSVSHDSIVFYYDASYMVLLLEINSDTIEINHIKHVHQLQNLYFALTNKELTIN